MSKQQAKYPGQRQAYRVGAWSGDGSEPVRTRQRKRKADRWAKKQARKMIRGGA